MIKASGEGMTSYLKSLASLKLKEQSFKKMSSLSRRRHLEGNFQEVVDLVVLLTLLDQAQEPPCLTPEATRPTKVQVGCQAVEYANV